MCLSAAEATRHFGRGHGGQPAETLAQEAHEAVAEATFRAQSVLLGLLQEEGWYAPSASLSPSPPLFLHSTSHP